MLGSLAALAALAVIGDVSCDIHVEGHLWIQRQLQTVPGSGVSWYFILSSRIFAHVPPGAVLAA